VLGRIELPATVLEFRAGTALFASIEQSGEEPGLVVPIYVSLCDQRSEACATLGDFRQALASATEALRMATETRHPLSLARANLCLGTVHFLHGDVDTAVPFLEESLTISSEEALSFWVRAREYFAYALMLLGERERGLEILARVLEQSTVGLMPQWEMGRYRRVTASVYLAAGCPEEARAEIRQELAGATERNARAYRAPLLRMEAEVLSEQTPPEPAGALERLREAAALAAELGMRPEVAMLAQRDAYLQAGAAPGFYSPGHRRVTDAEELRHLAERLPGLEELLGPHSVEHRARSPQPGALGPDPPEAGHDALPDQLPLELRDGGQDVEEETPGRCGGVDRLVEDHQVHPEGLERSGSPAVSVN
jgi:hypothetical protein